MSHLPPEPGRTLLALAMANRHGLITDATGGGGTVTPQTLADGFSRAAVPVFAVDVKGDLAGLAMPSAGRKAVADRAKLIGLRDRSPAASTVFWDLYGEQGCPIRATVAERGPRLIARMVELDDTQAGVLAVPFLIADGHGLPLRQTSAPTAAPRRPAWGEQASRPEPEPGGLLDGIEGARGPWWNRGGSNRGRMTNGQRAVRSAPRSAARSVGTQVPRRIVRGGLRR